MSPDEFPNGTEAGLCPATIDFDAAQAILAAHALPLGVERVPLAKAGRRCLAEPVRAQTDSPHRNTAAMDGYAIRAAEWDQGRRQFRVEGTSLAGAPSLASVPRRGAVRIMTGAPMPPELDMVVMLELASDLERDVHLNCAPGAKRHVRLRASDFACGEVLLPAGRVIDPRAMVVAAAADAASLAVWRRPRVACIAGGDELAVPGFAVADECKVPDSLSQALLLLSQQWGAKPDAARIVPDDLAELTGTARSLLEQCDVLVMIGGAARGDRDLAKSCLVPLGLEIAFADVAIKPGKPVWYGRIGERHVLGLPGNPTAAMTIARLFLAPLLAALGGRGAPSALEFAPFRLAEAAPANQREQFLCARRKGGEAHIDRRQSASMQGTLAHADLLVRIPAGGGLDAGATAGALRF